MNGFFKIFFATLLAIVVASAIPFLIFVGIVSSIASFGEKAPVAIKQNSVLRIDLSRPITDDLSDNPMDYFDYTTFRFNAPQSLLGSVTAIEQAAFDDRISAVVIDASNGFSLSLSACGELRKAIERFKESGKPVYSYSIDYPQGAYYLASVADSVFVNPSGNVDWTGLSAQVMMLKGLMDKAGVKATLLRAGKFKSAGEPYVLSQMSEENREETKTLLNSIWENIIGTVAQSRSIETAELQRYANELVLRDAKSAQSAGMVDEIYYKDQFVSMLETAYGKDFPIIGLQDYAAVLPSLRSVKNGMPVVTSKNKIMVIDAVGSIVDGRSSSGSVGDATLNAKLAEARKDSTVKAVVLRVNSPGGSALASELMWRELSLLREKKPLIVSMGDYAASGGYYIATAADAILADPNTITGSIGVFGLIFNVGKTANLLGINVETIKTNKHAGIYTSFYEDAPIDPQVKDYIQHSIDEIYALFLKRVSQGRNIPLERVEELAQGRVYSGTEALRLGLIDNFGGIEQAVLLAAEKAGVVEDFITVSPEVSMNPFQQVVMQMSESVKSWSKPDFGVFQGQFEHLFKIVEGSRHQAVIPYLIKMN